MTTLDTWINRVGGSVRVAKADDVRAIALLCVAAEEKDEYTCTWHAAAQFYGSQCHCARCDPRSRPFG